MHITASNCELHAERTGPSISAPSGATVATTFSAASTPRGSEIGSLSDEDPDDDPLLAAARRSSIPSAQNFLWSHFFAPEMLLILAARRALYRRLRRGTYRLIRHGKASLAHVLTKVDLTGGVPSTKFTFSPWFWLAKILSALGVVAGTNDVAVNRLVVGNTHMWTRHPCATDGARQQSACTHNMEATFRSANSIARSLHCAVSRGTSLPASLCDSSLAALSWLLVCYVNFLLYSFAACLVLTGHALRWTGARLSVVQSLIRRAVTTVAHYVPQHAPNMEVDTKVSCPGEGLDQSTAALKHASYQTSCEADEGSTQLSGPSVELDASPTSSTSAPPMAAKVSAASWPFPWYAFKSLKSS